MDGTEKLKLSRDELAVPSAKTSRILRQLYLAARERSEWKERLLHKKLPTSISEKMHASTFSRWVKGDDETLLPPQAHVDLLDVLAACGAVDPRAVIRDSLKSISQNTLFHALSLSLNIQLHTLNNVATRAEGLYRLWRSALHWRGRFVLGKLRVWEDQDDYCIHTRETNQFKGNDRSIPRQTIIEGYMLRKSGQHFIVAQDDALRSPHITLFDSAYHEEGDRIVGLGGVAIGRYGKNIHANRVYLERWIGTEEELDKQLDLVEEEQVPQSVLQKLSDLKATQFDVTF